MQVKTYPAKDVAPNFQLENPVVWRQSKENEGQLAVCPGVTVLSPDTFAFPGKRTRAIHNGWL